MRTWVGVRLLFSLKETKIQNREKKQFIIYNDKKGQKSCKNSEKRRYILDGDRKKWYYNLMENVEEINKKIAKNLAHYRKAAGYTQAELAEKINYSDKSVSKWEQGNGVPDVYVLLELSALYGVSVDDLLNGDAEEQAEEIKNAQTQKHKKTVGLHVLIMLLSVGIVWLVATCLFVGFQIWKPNGYAWLTFIFAIPVTAILTIVYSGVWKYRFLNFLSVSVLIWTSITSVFLGLTFLFNSLSIDSGWLWCLFLLGIPLQILEVLWVFFRTLFQKVKNIVKIRNPKKEKAVQTVKEEVAISNQAEER